jgi:hypothetical protein
VILCAAMTRLTMWVFVPAFVAWAGALLTFKRGRKLAAALLALLTVALTVGIVTFDFFSDSVYIDYFRSND